MNEAPEGSNGQQGQGRAIGQQPGNQRQNYTSQFVVGCPQRAAEPKETDAHRIAQRQKQIDYGKNTLGYQRYTEEVPRYLRRKISTRIAVHPETPDVRQICSKRSFDGQAKKWRRELHLWDPVEDDDLLDPVMMGQGAESPEASIGTRGSSRNVAVAGWPEPQARTEPAPEDSASDVSEPEDEKPDNEGPGPDLMFSPKKQRGENGRAIPQQLMPSRLGGATSQETHVYGAGRRPPGTGSKRRHHDMDPEPAHASQDDPHPLAGAAIEFQAEGQEEPAPWNELSDDHQDAAAGTNEQSDNIFGPAHEFD